MEVDQTLRTFKLLLARMAESIAQNLNDANWLEGLNHLDTIERMLILLEEAERQPKEATDVLLNIFRESSN